MNSQHLFSERIPSLAKAWVSFPFVQIVLRKTRFQLWSAEDIRSVPPKQLFVWNWIFWRIFSSKMDSLQTLLKEKSKHFSIRLAEQRPLWTLVKRRRYISPCLILGNNPSKWLRNSGELYPVFTLTYLFTSFKSTSRPSEVYFPTRIAFPMNLNLLSFTNTVVRLATHPISAPPPGS